MSFEKGDPPYTFSTASPSLIRQVSESLDQICTLNIEDVVKLLPQLAEMARQEGYDQALATQLNSDHDDKRVLAASFLLLQREASPQFVSRELVARCDRILIHTLQHGSRIVRGLALGMMAHCAMLTDYKVPVEALAPLRKLVTGPDEKFAPLAAMALCNSPYPEPDAFRVLDRAMDSKDQSRVGMVAPALLKLGVHDDRAFDIINERFPTFSPFIQRSILLTIAKIGPPAIGLFDKIAAVLVDSTQGSTHYFAASSLGNICCGTDRATPLLMKALRSSESMIMDGAVEGLAASKRIPQEAIDLIIARISDPDVRLRGSAASAMETIRGFDETFIPVLIRRLQDETDPDALAKVARSLAVAGKPAIPPLLECFLRGNAQESLYAANALVTIGKDAAQAIADDFPTFRDAQELALVLNLLESMGRESAPAVPLFAEFLDCIENELVALLIIRMLFFCGPPAQCAIPSLIRYIAERGSDNDDVNIWIRRTLASHLPHSCDALRQAIDSAAGEPRRRLEAMLADIDGAGSQPPSRLSGFSDIEAISRFVAMGDMLLAKGSCSMRGLEALLRAASVPGERKRDGLSAASLKRAVDALEEWIGEPLIFSPNKKSVALTPGGKEFLEECRHFLKNSDRSTKT